MDEALEWVRDYLKALKHGRLKPFTFVERKTLASTRAGEKWGPTGAPDSPAPPAHNKSCCAAGCVEAAGAHGRRRRGGGRRDASTPRFAPGAPQARS